MKKQGWILIGITGAFLCLLLGVFLGRNLNKGYIPVQNVLNTQTQPTEESKPLYDGKMDINTATAQQLQLLPGIGEALAQRIIEYRTEHGGFSSVEDLMNVSGIGEKKFEGLRDYVKIG
ncbi:MAG: helix-hairpin-helix domain-containing protein [Oscillospiraceae bacterium]|nr:helix-hairpin-helix domain-containing protein [Oscillospiraceae bacterium]